MVDVALILAAVVIIATAAAALNDAAEYLWTRRLDQSRTGKNAVTDAKNHFGRDSK